MLTQDSAMQTRAAWAPREGRPEAEARLLAPRQQRFPATCHLPPATCLSFPLFPYPSLSPGATTTEEEDYQHPSWCCHEGSYSAGGGKASGSDSLARDHEAPFSGPLSTQARTGVGGSEREGEGKAGREGRAALPAYVWCPPPLPTCVRKVPDLGGRS